MMIKKPKFIVYGDKILLGLVVFHKHLIPKGGSQLLVRGGGYYEIDQENKVLILSGKSVDFGKFDKDAALSAELPKSLKGYKVHEF